MYSHHTLVAVQQAVKLLVDDIDRWIERMYPDEGQDVPYDLPPLGVGDRLCALTEVAMELSSRVSGDDAMLPVLTATLHTLVTEYETALRQWPLPRIT